MAVVPLLVAAGCDPTGPCVAGVEPGGRYGVDVIERYDEQSQFTYTSMIGMQPGWTSGRCALPDGILPGASFVLRGTGLYERRTGSCDSVTADLSTAPAGFAVVGPATNQGVTEHFRGYGSAIFFRGDVTFGDCAGTLGLSVHAGVDAAEIFDAPVAGSYPKAVLFELFAPSDPADTTCPSCFDDYVIRFSKL